MYIFIRGVSMLKGFLLAHATYVILSQEEKNVKNVVIHLGTQPGNFVIQKLPLFWKLLTYHVKKLPSQDKIIIPFCEHKIPCFELTFHSVLETYYITGSRTWILTLSLWLFHRTLPGFQTSWFLNNKPPSPPDSFPLDNLPKQFSPA